MKPPQQPQLKRDRKVTNIVISPKDLENRFCVHCYIKLNYDEHHNIFKCPRCNVSTTLANTSPDTKIRTTFPAYNANESSNSRKHIVQSEDERLPRSEIFIRKRLAEKNKEENNDPYLQIMKSRNDLHITNVEYYSHEDSEYLYD